MLVNVLKISQPMLQKNKSAVLTQLDYPLEFKSFFFERPFRV